MNPSHCLKSSWWYLDLIHQTSVFVLRHMEAHGGSWVHRKLAGYQPALSTKQTENASAAVPYEAAQRTEFPVLLWLLIHPLHSAVWYPDLSCSWRWTSLPCWWILACSVNHTKLLIFSKRNYRFFIVYKKKYIVKIII